jgi:Holliday junction resolvase RusA-like endonuclease
MKSNSEGVLPTPEGGEGGRGVKLPTSFTIEYTGQMVSMNAYYAGNSHWKRKKIKDTYRDIFIPLIRKVDCLPKGLESFKTEFRYSTIHDPDNIVGTIKLFMDCLKEEGVIKDDSPKFWKKLIVIPDKSIGKKKLIGKVDWKS